ncbi:hypothetical protein WS62_04635 [Burkholderia sp. ABCPW 14]|nr:hypothetical protein WS62_04635 [Burkholderia sp. ABCPW 14]
MRVEAALDESLVRRDAQRAQYVASAREAIDPGMMLERRAPSATRALSRLHSAARERREASARSARTDDRTMRKPRRLSLPRRPHRSRPAHHHR